MQDISANPHTTDNSKLRVGIICSRFNEFIVEGLLAGARRGLTKCNINQQNVMVAWVPGAFEIPLAAQVMASSGSVDLIVALGAVIRGDTAHFEYVAGPCANGIASVQLQSGVPIGFGVLTTETVQQAVYRSSPGAGNKGEEALTCAVELWQVLHQLK